MSMDETDIDHGLAQMRGNSAAHSFSPDYLAAKKTIDDRALNKKVWRKLAQELARHPATSPLKILEIGAGIGTMFERVIDWGLLKGQVIYTAIDSDPLQTAAARDYLTNWAERKKHSLQWDAYQQARLRTAETMVEIDIRQLRIEELAAGFEPPHSWDLIIAHAVLDLIDFTALLPDLLALLKDRGLFYTTCNFNGATSFSPPCKGDEEIINYYHQSMDQRCFGASITGRRLLSNLKEQGLDLLASGPSDWLIEPQEQGYSPEESYFLGVIIAMVEKELAADSHPAPHSADWIRLRRQQVSASKLSFTAHHLDILARYLLPAGR
ncbi:MAG: class I SAM-dependent methyltransferase [Desulfofustis sp.]|nr:class I SAM-dependent methyltransferase [Desulfofustis sp.]